MDSHCWLNVGELSIMKSKSFFIAISFSMGTSMVSGCLMKNLKWEMENDPSAIKPCSPGFIESLNKRGQPQDYRMASDDSALRRKA